MGNNIGRGKKAKVMKIDGETIKLKTPIRAADVVKDYPGYVLLESEAVKQFGIRAKPLEPEQELKARKIYFLVELPKISEENNKEPRTRRARSAGIHMSAKERLEFLMLSKRSVSDLSITRPPSGQTYDGPEVGSGQVRLKVKLPKTQMQKLVEESKDNGEVAEKIINLYMANSGEVGGGNGHRHVHWKPELGSIGENIKATDQKRVGFVSKEEEIHVALPSY